MSDIVLTAKDMAKHYSVGGGLFKPTGLVKALDGVSFQLVRNKTLAVVGESGCGKSTLAKLVTMIETPTSGELNINGIDVATATDDMRKSLRPKVQIVFQNPYGSLNPRQRIGSALVEPLSMNTDLSSAEKQKRAKDMMAAVGLRPEHFDRYPHMFSGGQRQRIAIARALMLEPEILVLDEPVSALDVSIQAQVLNVLSEMQEKFNLAYLFISHDLSVVKHIADDVMVMYLGKAVEKASREELFKNPSHPYTRALLSATPVPDPTAEKNRVVLTGELPSPLDPPSGCAFHPRCPQVFDKCAIEGPVLKGSDKHLMACHLQDK